VAAAILDLEKRILRRLATMYNILPGNRSCDQERRSTIIQDGGRLFKLVCSSLVDVGKLQKL